MKTSAKKYKTAGVNIAAGDAASSLAGKHARTTFASRAGKIGKPAALPGGFAGALDFGQYYLTQCDDGTGTKMVIAEELGKYDTIGADLAAMVVDDAVCLGAECVSLSNTLDVPKVDAKVIDPLLKGLAKACKAQKVVIPGGEIAEVGKTVNGYVWNATAVGILEKKKLIDGSKIKVGDAVIALQEKGLRSNGFSLARHILEKKFGKNYAKKAAVVGGKKLKKSWGELLLIPSTIYHAAVLELIGRYGAKRKVNVRGICHVTGGGISGNLPRIFKANKKKLGASLPDLWATPAWVKELIQLGNVSEAEAREVWNLGNGMLLVVPQKEVTLALKLLKKAGVQAKIAGTITGDGKITF